MTTDARLSAEALAKKLEEQKEHQARTTRAWQKAEERVWLLQREIDRLGQKVADYVSEAAYERGRAEAAEQRAADLEAEVEADKFRKRALQDSIDGCAQKVVEITAKQRAAEQRAEAAKKLALQATNGWACYAKRGIEHEEIARLHAAIKALSTLSPAPEEPRS